MFRANGPSSNKLLKFLSKSTRLTWYFVANDSSNDG